MSWSESLRAKGSSVGRARVTAGCRVRTGSLQRRCSDRPLNLEQLHRRFGNLDVGHEIGLARGDAGSGVRPALDASAESLRKVGIGRVGWRLLRQLGVGGVPRVRTVAGP